MVLDTKSLFQIIILIFLFSFSSVLLQAEEFEDKSENWKVAVIETETVNIPDDMQQLATVYPGRFMEFLSAVDFHFLTDDEVSARQNVIYSEKLDSLLKSISSKRKNLDSSFFKRERKESDESSLEKDIYNLNEKLEDYKKFDLSTIKINRKLPLELVYKDEKNKILYNYDPFIETRRQFAQRVKADYVIFSRLEKISDYLFLSVEIFSNSVASVIYEDSVTGNYTSIKDDAFKFKKEIVLKGAGREWSSLTVSVTPLTAAISIDGIKRGAGYLNVPLIEPGKHLLEIEEDGFFTDKIEIEIDPFEEREIDVVLRKKLVDPVLINTFPANADLYLSSKWVGKTPFILLNPGMDEHFLIRKQGYLDYSGYVDENLLINQEFIFLNSLESATKEMLEQKRTEFYTSLALLSFSLPVTLMSAGFRENLSPESGTFTQSQQYSAYYATEAAFVAGIMLNVIMGINMIVQSIEYVEYADIM